MLQIFEGSIRRQEEQVPNFEAWLLLFTADGIHPDFRTCDIKIDAATLAGSLLGFLQIFDHLQPDGTVVMGAVDTGDVHAALQQADEEVFVGCGLLRKGDHDPGRPVLRRIAQ